MGAGLRFFLCIASCAASLLAAVPCAARQSGPPPDYPVKSIRIIVASSPGTASDVFARSIGEELGAFYRQSVMIDNRTGAGGLIGNMLVSKANADGYTLGMVDVTRIITELMRDQPPYRALADVVGVAHVASITNVLAVARSHSGAHGARVRGATRARARRAQLRLARHRLGVASRRRGVHARGRHRRGARAVPEPVRLLRRDAARAGALRRATRCRRCWRRCAREGCARSRS